MVPDPDLFMNAALQQELTAPDVATRFHRADHAGGAAVGRTVLSHGPSTLRSEADGFSLAGREGREFLRVPVDARVGAVACTVDRRVRRVPAELQVRPRHSGEGLVLADADEVPGGFWLGAATAEAPEIAELFAVIVAGRIQSLDLPEGIRSAQIRRVVGPLQTILKVA